MTKFPSKSLKRGCFWWIWQASSTIRMKKKTDTNKQDISKEEEVCKGNCSIRKQDLLLGFNNWASAAFVLGRPGEHKESSEANFPW